ncbi:Thioredoxin [Kosakonia arachidis]|uniref:Thioredoxin n=1 Tax=Kosakonia arachidis TaxID=551989 RepID=A0A1I7E9G3_9ENTR|nr:thioredoxin family protein [Kosakonia arachidis]SFU20570.1 Thioredoxin [Kosakonia arachidis]
MSIFNATTVSEFREKIQTVGSKLIVVYFITRSSNVLETIEKNIEEVSLIYQDVIFIRVNTDDAKSLAIEYNIRTYPSFVFIKQCNVLCNFIKWDYAELIKIIEHLN